MWISKKLNQSTDKSFHLVEDANFKCGELTQALSDYLHGLKGLHVAIVCSDSKLEIVRRELEENFNGYSHISVTDLDKGEVISDGWKSGKYVCYCQKDTPPDVLKTIVAVVDYLGRNVGKAQNLVDETLAFRDDPESVWTKNVARRINQALLEGSTEGCFADIKIVTVMPRDTFSTFSNRGLYFPEFIECVLLEDPPATGEEKALLELIRQNNLTKEDIYELAKTRKKIIVKIENHLKSDLDLGKNLSYNVEELNRVIEETVSIHEIVKQNEKSIDQLVGYFKKYIQLRWEKKQNIRDRDTMLPYLLEQDRGGGGVIKIALLGETRSDFAKTRKDYDESQLPNYRDDRDDGR